jgi:hypothetical protein
MFGPFKDKRLLEQKIMIWQYFFCSLDCIKTIEEDDTLGGQDQYQKDLNMRLLEKLKDIHAMSSYIINNGNHKKLLSKNHLNYIWQDNKALRGIF